MNFKKRPGWKVVIFSGIFLVLCFLLIFFALAPDLPVEWAREILIVRDPLQSADMIYVLGGNFLARAPKAAALYKSGFAQRIVIAREQAALRDSDGKLRNFTDITVGMMEDAGVPASAILQLRPVPAVSTTAGECDALRAYLTEKPSRRVIVVTSAIHTRRAGYMVRRALRGMGVDVRLAPAEAPGLEEGSDAEVKREFEKLILHFVF